MLSSSLLISSSILPSLSLLLSLLLLFTKVVVASGEYLHLRSLKAVREISTTGYQYRGEWVKKVCFNLLATIVGISILTQTYLCCCSVCVEDGIEMSIITFHLDCLSICSNCFLEFFSVVLIVTIFFV